MFISSRSRKGSGSVIVVAIVSLLFAVLALWVATNKQQAQTIIKNLRQAIGENTQVAPENQQLVQQPEWWTDMDSVKAVVVAIDAIAGDQPEFFLAYNSSINMGPVKPDVEILVLGWKPAPPSDNLLVMYEYGVCWNSFNGWQIYRTLKPTIDPSVRSVTGFQYSGIIYDTGEHKP